MLNVYSVISSKNLMRNNFNDHLRFKIYTFISHGNLPQLNKNATIYRFEKD